MTILSHPWSKQNWTLISPGLPGAENWKSKAKEPLLTPKEHYETLRSPKKPKIIVKHPKEPQVTLSNHKETKGILKNHYYRKSLDITSSITTIPGLAQF